MSTTISKEALEANSLFRKLSGKTDVDINEQRDDSLTDIFNEIDNIGVEEKTKKKKRGSGIKTNVGKGMGEKPDYLPDWDKAQLPKSIDVDIFFPQHFIHYKEQLWPVHDRTIKYNIELCRFPQLAYNCLERAGYSKEDCLRAKSGEIRVYDIKTYESAKIEVKSLGTVILEEVNGKIKKTLVLNTKGISKTSLEQKDVKQRITKKMNILFASL